MVNELNFCENLFSNLIFHYNDEEFINDYFCGDCYAAACAASDGDYNSSDEFVRINDYGDLESVNALAVEEILDDHFDEIVTEYIAFLNEGKIGKWRDLFEEVDEE